MTTAESEKIGDTEISAVFPDKWMTLRRKPGGLRLFVDPISL
jgi:hypothetical protein